MILYPLHQFHNPEKEYNNYSKKSPGNIAKLSLKHSQMQDGAK